MTKMYWQRMEFSISWIQFSISVKIFLNSIQVAFVQYYSSKINKKALKENGLDELMMSNAQWSGLHLPSEVSFDIKH